MLRLAPRRPARRDHPDTATAFADLPEGMDNNQESVAAVLPEGYPSILAAAMLPVIEGECRWIQKHLRSTLETYPVFPEIPSSLPRIPLEHVLQPALLSTTLTV